MPPGDILEFWNYIAYAFYKKKLPYPEFMSVITDLGHVQKKMADWEQEREVASWYERIEQVNERPPQDAPLTVAFRLVATINEARIEVKEEKAGVWIQLREKNDIETLRQSPPRSRAADGRLQPDAVGTLPRVLSANTATPPSTSTRRNPAGS